MAVTPRVGGEVDAFCTRCKLTLAHTILAMVGTKIARVRCNTCGGDHSYRSDPGSRPAPTPTRERAERPERVVLSFEAQLGDRDTSRAPPYSPKDTYTANALLRHPNFGLGVVADVRGDKIEVAFKVGVKTLIHGRGGAPAEKPAYHPPAAAADRPADKPFDED
jgi:hypothetical protein